MFYDRGLSKEEEFGLGGLNMDGPIIEQGVRDSKRACQETKFSHGGKEEEAKLIYFSQLLE